MFDAVIFDFDGVILDSEPIHYEACCHVFNSIGLTLSYHEFKEKYIGLSDKEMFPLLLVNHGFHFTPAEINAFINNKIEQYTQIIKHHHNLPMISDVDKYIQKIVQDGKKIAICSGSMRIEVTTVLAKLKQGTLQPFFNTIITSDDVQLGKPSPEGYLLTAERLNVAPDKCLVIEDAPHGIAAAKSAGMFVIALSTTQEKHQLHKADRTVDSFVELLESNE